MSSTTQLKRKRVEVVVISDSDDSTAAENSNTSSTQSNRTVDAASKHITDILKRWPPKRKKTTNAVACLSVNTSDSHDGEASQSERRGFWNIHELLAERENVDRTVTQNIVRLFEQENTIPFICRYRRDLVNQITPERLREIKSSYNEIINLRKKADNMVVQLQKENIANANVYNQILAAKTMDELEFLYTPYRQTKEGSLVNRAKALGLEPHADNILNGTLPEASLQSIVDPNNPKLNTSEKVIDGIRNIISHNISKDADVLEKLGQLQLQHCVMLKTKKCSTTSNKEVAPSPLEFSKFESYFNFEMNVRYIKPHQILAINRGERLKCLTVKIMIPEELRIELVTFIRNKFLQPEVQYDLLYHIMQTSIEDCYSKKLKPLMMRQIRSNLNAAARKESIEVFARNLKQLLLMSPLKGERILGIDPGFVNGCKYAMISETADVLETGVLYPHTKNTDPELLGEQLSKMLARHNCTTIALGNGKGCRETEHWLAKLFNSSILDGSKVKYSIVSEQGASIYSCSELASKEFPDKDINERSAISIARRLNDPLSEYVKIEPRHIGVGMYQHDMNDKALTESLNEVVSECVSFVGVDINTASLSVLKHVAGLTEKKAAQIIAYRTNNGPFLSRSDLLKVRTIGEKTFTQCAGFIRIEPRTINGNVNNLLDCTWVHPESYDVARRIIMHSELSVRDIGKPHFIKKMRHFAQQAGMMELSKNFKVPKERVEIILEALQRELFQDYRADIDKTPLFRKGITKLIDISVGDTVKGAVNNTTNFGAFVDIGVERNALMHKSDMRGNTLNIGDRITAKIKTVDVRRKRINLSLISVDN